VTISDWRTLHLAAIIDESMFDYLAKDRRRLRRRTRAFAKAVDSGPAKVFVDHGFQWDGANNIWLTRARASFVMGTGPPFDIRPRGFLSRVIGMTGGVSSGDPCFDDFFVVRTTDSDTWRALTTRARSLLASHFDDARLVSDGHNVTLWREADFGREVDGDAAVEAVAEIVSFQALGLDSLRRLPGARFRPASGPWFDRKTPSIAIHVPGEVVIEPIEYRGRPVLSASANCGRETAPFRIAIDGVGRVLGDEPVPSVVRSAALSLGACAFRCDGSKLIVRWPTLAVDRKRVLAGVQIVGSFAKKKRQGLYR